MLAVGVCIPWTGKIVCRRLIILLRNSILGRWDMMCALPLKAWGSVSVVIVTRVIRHFSLVP